MNSIHPSAADSRPWYREPYVWLVILFPASAVIVGMIMLRLAIVSNDGLVHDDYYKRGMAINMTLERDRSAAAHGLHGEFVLAAEEGRAYLDLEASPGFRFPPMLQVNLLHATRAGQDQSLILARQADGRYVGPVAALGAGKWHVQVKGEDWRLVDKLFLPNLTAVTLRPQTAP